MFLENKPLRHFSWDVSETHWSSTSIGIYSMILWSKNLVPWILKGEYIPPVRLLIHNKDWPVTFKINFKSKYQLSSVVSDSLRPHGLQHTRPLCPSPTPEACSNSCPSHQWCHPTISYSVISFSSHLQSFPASGSFQMSQFFASGDHWSFQLQHQSFQWILSTDFL